MGTVHYTYMDRHIHIVGKHEDNHGYYSIDVRACEEKEIFDFRIQRRKTLLVVMYM